MSKRSAEDKIEKYLKKIEKLKKKRRLMDICSPDLEPEKSKYIPAI